MSNTQKKTILLVEDDEVIVSFLRVYLVYAGYEVFDSSDGLAALSAAAHVRPDVIITDLSMPRMDGLRFIKEIKTGPDRDLRSTPIIVISGASDEMQLEALGYGASVVLKKPIHRRPLLEAVANVLRE